MNTWFTADSHYGHKNICRGASEWMKRFTKDGQEPTNQQIAEFHNSTRDFSTVDKMNQTIVDNINAKVGQDDILWHLGDWAMGGMQNIEIFRDRLVCKNIHLVLGNHDKSIVKYPEKFNKLFSSVQTTFGWPVFGKSKIGGTSFMLSHFPMFVWDKHMHGSIHLHGHSHGSLKMPGMNTRKILDVGMDNHPEFRPFHIDEIKKMMAQRGIEEVDHHTPKTAQ